MNSMSMSSPGARPESQIMSLARSATFLNSWVILFCSGVPQSECAIIAPGRQPLPVGREGYRPDIARMPLEGEQLLAGGGVPQLDCAIITPGQTATAASREAHQPAVARLTPKGS